MAARAITGALLSPGRIIDPLVANVSAHAGSTSVFARLNHWRHRRRNDAENKYDHGRLKRELPEFEVAGFLRQQAEDYKEVLDAVTSGSLSKLKHLTTEHTYTLIKRGVEAGVAEFGARQGARLVEWLESPSFVHARMSWTSAASTLGVRNPLDPPDWVQLTVRNVTLQQPVADAAPVTPGDHRRRPLASTSSAVASPGEAASAWGVTGLGAWLPVLDPASGHPYYWNEATGEVTWVKPAASRMVPGRTPFRIETAGMTRTQALDRERSAGGAPYMKVVHYVVWERCLRPGVPGVWRVAKL